MADCLLTKLKASVTDVLLPKLGVITLDIVGSTFDANSFVRFSIASGLGNIVLKLKGTAHFTNSTNTEDRGQELTYGGPQSNLYVWISDGTGVVEIENKYGLALLSPSTRLNGNVKELDFTGVSNLEGAGWRGLISDLPTTIQEVNYSANFGLSGSVKDFSRLVDATRLSVIGIPATVQSCDISDFGALVDLTYFRMTWQSQSRKLTGSIEEFVASQRANGRTVVSSTSPVVTQYLNENAVTFNGAAITGGTAKNLYWDASTITYDGVTITA